MSKFEPFRLWRSQLGVGLVAILAAAPLAGAQSPSGLRSPASGFATRTPIKHLVVIFQENVSFDHYFGTYPKAANPPGEPAFHALPHTPSVNGLSAGLLSANPNRSNPQRLDRSQAFTCDQNHDYTAEQAAFDKGLMDKFVQSTGAGKTVAQCTGTSSGKAPNYAVMDYFDGNTVTGLWNYAQHFALSDNSYGTNFGPSSPGAVNVTAGNTYGAICGPAKAVYGAPACTTPPGGKPNVAAGLPASPQGPGTMYSDADPYFDVCSNGGAFNASKDIQMGGTNIGNLLDARHVTWGWFEGGFSSSSLRARKALHRQPGQRLHRLAHEHRGPERHRLHPPSRAVPVLRFDREPAAPAAHFGQDDRPPGPGEPPVCAA